jgi:hypothetical protein
VYRGDTPYTLFCLVGNDVIEREGEGRHKEIVTALWFAAYDTLGGEILANARKGDQLFVEAIAQTMMATYSAYDHSFIVRGFRFGVRKGSLESPLARTGNRPPVTSGPSAEEAVALSA